MSPVFRDVVERLEEIRSGLLSRSAKALGLAALLGAVMVGLVALALASGWRDGSPLPLILDLSIVGMCAGLVAAYRWSGRRPLGERGVAESIESVSGLPSGTLYSSVELARNLPSGVSSGLAEQAARDVLAQLNATPGSLEGPLGRSLQRWTRRAAGAIALTAPLLVLLGILAPERAGVALQGLAHPVRALSSPALPPLRVTPGSEEVLRGADVTIGIRADRRSAVTLRWQVRGDVRRSEEILLEGGVGEYLLREVRAETRYSVEAPDGARSADFTLTPVDPLLVSDVSLTLTFPPHTGRFPEEYRGAFPALEIPVGTRMQIRGRASRPLGSVVLSDSVAGGRATPLEVDGESFSLDWVPARSGAYVWSFEGESGESPEIAPSDLHITLLPDLGPGIEILLPGRDTVLAASLRQPLVIEVGDDYGVDRVELVVYRVSALGERDEPVVQSLDLGEVPAALVRPVMDLSRWNLLMGDTVRYFARAVDNAPAAQMATTPEYALRLPTRSDLRNEAQRRLDEAAGRVEELAAEAGEQADELRDLERRSASDVERQAQRQAATDRAEFEEQEDVRQALDREEGLLNRVDSLEAELDRLRQEMAELADPDLQDDLSELQRMLEEMSSEELREQLEQLAENLDSPDPDQASQALSDLAESQEELRERLEEALERFKRAAMEQEFRATAQEAEELARQEEALARAMEEGTEPELRADQQEVLEERAEALEERLEDLRQRLQEEGEPQAREAVENASREGERAREAMQRAEQASRRGQMQEAAEAAQEASDRMEQMAEELENAQGDMAQQMMEALQQALEQTSADALALARRQSEIREEMRGASQETLAGLRGDEAALLSGVQNMAENLAVLNQLAQNDGREISSSIGKAMDAIERTIEAMEDRRGRTPSPFSAAETAAQTLNQIALTAMESAQQLGQAGQSQASEQMMEQLEQLAQEQASVNEQTGQITPMQLGEQAAEAQMQEAAQGQQQIADELGELADDPGGEGDPLGDLESLAEEAEALAQQLAGGRLDAQLRDRQQRLFHRLLDAGRSLEKEEESDERESEAPGEFERGTVLPLSPEDLATFRFRVPNATELRGLSAAERQMVLQYFERLNRQRAQAGGGGR